MRQLSDIIAYALFDQLPVEEPLGQNFTHFALGSRGLLGIGEEQTSSYC